MTDLIWIGNTLYPRWFVITVAVGTPVVIMFAAAVGRFLWVRRRFRQVGDM